MNAGRQPKSRFDAGFTLVEMLVVVVIVAMVASVALPLLGRPSAGLRLKAMTGEIIAALRLTREAAIVRNTETALMIDVDRHTLQSPVVPLRRLAPDVTTKLEFVAPEQAGRSSGGFRFFPDGSSTGGTVTLLLHDQQAKICIQWLTGEARQPPSC
jgi:general secretion pathway protein H